MRCNAVALLGALGLAASVTAASATPSVPPMPPPQTSNIEQVAGGCGPGFHRHHGYCVRNRRYRPYPHRWYYGSSRPYPYYYGDGHEPWNRPSPTDHVANQLNAQQLYRPWGY